MGKYFDKTTYPNLDLEVIGKLKNNAYGELEKVPAHGIVTGATSLLASDITAAATTLTVADESRFPATPFTVQINAERIRVTSKAGAVFTVTRGHDNTEAVAHSSAQTVFEVLTEYIYLLNDGPIKSIDAVYVDGIKQAAANYTAYTGQAGDAHTDWPGIAVVSFTASAYIARQYNIESATELQGDEVGGRVDFASHPELSNDDADAVVLDQTVSTWGVTIGLNGAGTTNQAFVKFDVDYGTINTQKYYIDVENASADERTINVDVMVTEGDALQLLRPFSIPKNESITLEVSRAGGIFDDVLRIYSYGSDLIVKDMRKTVLVDPRSFQEAGNLNLTQEVAILQQVLTNSPLRFATYPDTALGVSIVKQTHIVELVDTSGNDEFIELVISAVEKNGTVLKSKTMTLSGSDSFSGSITHSGGSYDTSTVVMINNIPTNSIENVKIKKLIEYTTDAATTTANLAATSAGKVIIGSAVSADAKFAVDVDGNYGGVGNLIQRPDWVVKHFLVNDRGAALGDIDTTTFAAAGSLYASASYQLNFLLTDGIDEDQMAYECRSVIYMTQGKYYLDFIPDTAPASIMTIPEGDVLDGVPGFIYDHGKIEDLHTSYTARHGIRSDGTWYGVVAALDAGNKYGVRSKTLDLPLVTGSAQAQSVLDNILLQHQELYVTVKFTVSWKYQTLKIGDTFTVSCSLYNGAKFFVEKLKIKDNNTIYIEAKNWW